MNVSILTLVHKDVNMALQKLTEKSVHIAVCEYLQRKYPHVIFTSESSGLKLSIGMAKQIKKQRSSSALPDLIILHPSKGYHGLCIEIKKSFSDLYRANGQRRKSEHLDEQAQILNKLSSLGYLAVFCCGIDECCSQIDQYLNY